MGTKTEPGRYDCHAKAEPDEPLFTLLARDPAAPGLLRDWVKARQQLALDGLMREGIEISEGERAKWNEALICAVRMESWRATREKWGRLPPGSAGEANDPSAAPCGAVAAPSAPAEPVAGGAP